MQERGLKLQIMNQLHCMGQVAPYAGAWIEIKRHVGYFLPLNVAPYAGAWIEIVNISLSNRITSRSLLMQERGLK